MVVLLDMGVNVLLGAKNFLELNLSHAVLVDHLHLVSTGTDNETLRYFVYASLQRSQSFFERRFRVMIPVQ